MLHNSHEFLPFVIYLKAPIVEDPDAIIQENGDEKSETEPLEEPLVQTVQTTVSVAPIVIIRFDFEIFR